MCYQFVESHDRFSLVPVHPETDQVSAGPSAEAGSDCPRSMVGPGTVVAQTMVASDQPDD